MGRGHTPGSDWSDAEIEKAAKLWRDGYSAGQIAALSASHPKRTRNAILGMMNRNRDKFPRKTAPGKWPGGARQKAANPRAWSPEEIATAQRMWLAKAPTPEIGAVIGRTSAAVLAFANGNRGLFLPRDPAKRKASPLPAEKTPRPKNMVDLAERFPPPPAAPECKPVTLLQRRDSQCHFPLWDHYGDKPTAESLYCGGDVAGDGHYCAYHRAIVYRPATVKPIKDEPLRKADLARRRAA